MGRDRCTSFINDSHEHSTKCTSRPRLLVHKSCMGWVDKLICKSRSYHTKLSSNLPMHKTLCRGGNRNLTGSHCRIEKMREACGGLGVDTTDAQFARVITLSMMTPSWDPVIGTIGGILDPKVVISHLNTKWSRRQGLTSTSKDPNVVFQTSTWLRCEKCNQPGNVKANFWSKGGSQEGQYPWKNNSQTSNTVNSVTDTPIVWACRPMSWPDVWFANSTATIHVSPKREDFSTYQKYDKESDINVFGNNMVKGAGEGDILANIKCGGKTMRIWLTQVMHIPGAKGKILSLKVLVQRGFESHILVDCIHITKGG